VKSAGISEIRSGNIGKNRTNELATKSNNKKIGYFYRGINEFKRGYQLRITLVMDAD
jgi:hypothetical protein